MDLDLGALEQLVEPSQVRAIADAMQKARGFMDGKRSLTVRLIVLKVPLDHRLMAILCGLLGRPGDFRGRNGSDAVT